MPSLNEVRLIGNLTRDPELRTTPTGQTVCNFGVAVNEVYSQNGERKETTVFVDCTCWNKTAENVAKYLHKGSLAYIGGKLRFESWEDKNSGQKRSKLSVTALQVQFLDKREDGNNQRRTAQYASPPATVMAGMGRQPWQGQDAPPPDMGEPPF